MSEKIIVSSSTGQKTIENINPAANNAVCASLGSALNDLTNGTYEKTDRVFRVNCDTEPGGGQKPEPTLTLSRTTATVSEVYRPGEASLYITVTTNSTGNLYFRPATIQDNVTKVVYGTFTMLDGALTWAMGKWGTGLVPQTVYIGVTETDNYAAKEVAFTITAE